MKVSIIIPTFNRADLILETLQSVMDQTYSDWECIIVDDGSTDDTKDVVSKFIVNDNRFLFLCRPIEREKGANACRNFGLENSSGNLINWLDSDDLLNPDHFEKHLEHHKSNTIIDASVSQNSIFEGNKTNIVGLWSKNFAEGNLLENMISSKISWSTPSVVWKKASLQQRPFNEKLASSQEWTFHVEQLIDDKKFKVFDDITVLVRRHDNRVGKDMSAKKFKSTFLSRYLVMEKLHEKNILTFNNETFLLMRMFQSVKSTVKYRYDTVLRLQLRLLFKSLFICKQKISILKIIFFSVPIYRTIGKGERLFKI